MLLRRLAAAGALLCSAPLLAACGEDDTGTLEVGDVVPARTAEQFERGRAAKVAVPIGRLQVWTGKPTDSVAAGDTRSLEALTAPEGATLVPVTWSFSDDFEAAQDFLGSRSVPVVDLVADGETYRLPSPDRATDGESFYVAVDGDAEKLRMEIAFDGVRQSVNLRTRKVDVGRAEALYDLEAGRLESRDCGSADWLDEERTSADYTCDVAGPLLLPYADGAWAKDGHAWLGVRIRTTLRSWGVSNGEGGGALYRAVGTRLKAWLADKSPVRAIQPATAECPAPITVACDAEMLFIFDVEADDVPTRLDVEQRYRLELGNRWGGFAPDDNPTETIGGRIRLEVPDGKRD